MAKETKKKFVPPNLGIKLVMADRVVVLGDNIAEKKIGSIIIPGSAQDKPTSGRVVAVGVDKDGKPLRVKVGDRIMYGKYSGTEMDFKGKEYMVMRETDVWFVIDEEEA